MTLSHTTLSTTGSTRGTAYGMSNKIVTHEGKTHVVWLDQIHKIYTATYDQASKTWSQPIFVGDGTDNHAGAAMTLDSKGHLYLAFGPHHNPMQHVKSTHPNDVSSWETLPSFGGVNATYPSLICDRHDVLHACYRGAYERERPWGIFYQQRALTGDWSSPVKLVDGQGPPAYTHYENAIHTCGDDLYLSFHIVRATPDNLQDIKGRGFGIMKSFDGGQTWKTVSGEPLSLPVTPDSPCVIEFDEGLDVRTSPVVCDRLGRPYFTLNRREEGVHETFFYRWRKNAWQVTPLRPIAEALVGECAMSDRCVLSMSDHDILYLAGVVCKRGGDWADPTNEIVLFTSRDLGETFNTYRISPEEPTVPNWLPSLERHTGHNKVEVPQLLYTHGDKGIGGSPDINTEIRHVFLNDITESENAAIDQAINGINRLSNLPGTKRAAVRNRIERQMRQYADLRDVPLTYDVEPPLVFVPSTPPKGKKKSCVFSSGESTRPVADEDLAFLPVTALSRLIQNKKISPVELTRVYLDRLARYGNDLTCVVTLTEKLALKQAQKAEHEILKGRYRGPLHGIPWGAKDLLSTKGICTTWGATPFKDQVPNINATVVERLQKAGAILVAKLSLGALASGPTWFAGMTRNPYNKETGASGSSAGPGAATAAGLVGFSIGSETHGSIVSPSHTCGVVGLRPTYGRVSRYGAMALSWTMDKVGPMCRRVEDCAAVFHAILGPDGKDRSVVNAPFTYQPRIDLSTLRMGYLENEFNKEAAGDDPDGLYENALHVMRQLGANLKPVVLPVYPTDALSMILMVETAAMFDDAVRNGDLDVMIEKDKSQWPDNLRAARAIPAVDYLRAQRIRTRLMHDMHDLMKNYDVILIPRQGRSSLTITNLTGHPVVILPCGFSNGMPRGLSFLGNLYDEATILAVAHAYEQATPWHTMHPIKM